jgi:hypothetical protein
MAKKTRFQPGKFKPEPKIGDVVRLRYDHRPTAGATGVIVGTNPRYKLAVNVLINGEIETHLTSFLDKV